MKMELAGREFKIANGPIQSGATGFVMVSLGDTVIMANSSMSEKGREGASFFPMFVDYEENFYAAGKIKGSRFVKRSGRPSENATLISRLIDRPIRPLFPKGVTNEVQIVCSCLSADLEVDPATTAMIYNDVNHGIYNTSLYGGSGLGEFVLGDNQFGKLGTSQLGQTSQQYTTIWSGCYF